jgi:hypothetical protein
VAVYRPDLAQPLPPPPPAPSAAIALTTPEPPVVPYQYQPALFDVSGVTPPPPRVAGFTRQARPPPPQQQQQKPPPQPNNSNRPLLFAKRRPESGGGDDASGGAQVSRPFEYLSKLSTFLSDRVFSAAGDAQRRLSSANRAATPRPQLITRRVPISTRR